MEKEKPTLKEHLIQEILNLPEKQFEEINEKIIEYKKSLISYDDEPLTEAEKKALNEAEKDLKNGNTVSYDDVFGDDKE
ncbi:MAG: hypothetical protein ABF683_13765 [Sporolactobacillus sp.]